jgi:4-diphosphocytidyl-2-C-methyl-D-erythritol kinase
VLTISAPAKINLTLEVLQKRADGYHDIRSVAQSLDLCDTLYLEESDAVAYACDLPGWSAEKSVLSKVVGALGVAKGVKITIEKRVPTMAGLGGDSSAAAALLKGLNELWRLKLPAKKQLEIAAKLGSDVPFFLHGGTTLMEGRGQKITPLPALPKMRVVLVVPGIPVQAGKTGRMYAALKPVYFTDGRITEKLVNALHKNKFDTTMLFNTFENVAREQFPGLKTYQEHLLKLGAAWVHLAGSGPALYTMFAEKSKAEDFYNRCVGQKLNVFLTETL